MTERNDQSPRRAVEDRVTPAPVRMAAAKDEAERSNRIGRPGHALGRVGQYRMRPIPLRKAIELG